MSGDILAEVGRSSASKMPHLYPAVTSLTSIRHKATFSNIFLDPADR